MSVNEVISAYVDATRSGDWDTCAALSASNFQFSGPTPQPLGLEQYIGFITTMNAGSSDMFIDLQIDSIEGNVARGTNTVSGTHDGVLDMSPMGMGAHQPTGKRFQLPPEPISITVEGDRVVSYAVEPTEGAGLPGVIEQLGLQV